MDLAADCQSSKTDCKKPQTTKYNYIKKQVVKPKKKACHKRRLKSALYPGRDLGALPTKQLSCVPQVVEWVTPGIIYAGAVKP